MSELSFLIDLLLNERLSGAVRAKIAERVKVVESQMITQKSIIPLPISPAQAQGQSPSTIAAMARHAQEPAPIVNSPAAQAALQNREIALAESMSGKPPPGRTSPRKF
jgi:hypothetical protein